MDIFNKEKEEKDEARGAAIKKYTEHFQSYERKVQIAGGLGAVLALAVSTRHTVNIGFRLTIAGGAYVGIGKMA